MKGDSYKSIKNFLKYYWSDSPKIINPQKVKEILDLIDRKFMGNKQQDSHEAFVFLIEQVHLDVNKGNKKKKFSEL